VNEPTPSKSIPGMKKSFLEASQQYHRRILAEQNETSDSEYNDELYNDELE